ncbi:MAG TPA: CBS domain-containing protein [bacterium]|nr:CBS domain-containing protein [bacterium]
MLVQECMITDPLTIGADATVSAAAESMRAARTGRVCVVAGDHLVGVATWGDLMRVPSSCAGSPADVAIATVMTKNPVVISAEAPIEEAARTIYWHDLRALPVVDGQTLVGLVTSRDVIGSLIRRGGTDILGITMTVALPGDLTDLHRLSKALIALRTTLSPFTLNVRLDRFEHRARIRAASTSLAVAEQLAAAGFTISGLRLDTAAVMPTHHPSHPRDEGSAPAIPPVPDDPLD